VTAVQTAPQAALKTAPQALRTAPRDALGRLAGLRHTSPGRLQLLLVVLLVLAGLTGLVAGLTARSATVGTTDLRDRAQPLLSEAEIIYSSLADANTTAAQAFITGGLEPPALTRRYDEKLDAAATALTSAARRVPAEGRAADAIRSISTGLGDYTALVATARAMNRQGKPVGASYLATASELNRNTLQPQAEILFDEARSEAQSTYNGARGAGWLVLLVTLVLVLAAALLWAQVYLSRATHRTFNVPLLIATGLVALMALTGTGVFVHQWTRLAAADRDGSAALDELAQRRILVLRERADEALTLAARSGHGPLEEDFKKLQERVSFSGKDLDPVGALMATAQQRHDEYLDLHRRIRELDDGGKYEDAVKLAVGEESARTFDGLTAVLDEAMADRRAAFDDRIRSAGRGLGLLTVLGPLLAVAICVFAAIGLRARLEEYR
jgi:hypothetical protein